MCIGRFLLRFNNFAGCPDYSFKTNGSMFAFWDSKGLEQLALSETGLCHFFNLNVPGIYYCGIDIATGTPYCLSRNLDMGIRFLYRVCSNGRRITSVERLNPSRYAGSTAGQWTVDKSIKVLLLGDSLSLPYPDTQVSWPVELFTKTHAVTVENYSVGTQSSLHGMLMVGKAIHNSPAFDPVPHLTIIGYYNQCRWKLHYIETLVIRARESGSKVIIHTALPDVNKHPRDIKYEGGTLYRIAVRHGAFLLDTWARNEHAIRQGESLQRDGLHQSEDGHRRWAEWMHTAFFGVQTLSTRYDATSKRVVNGQPWRRPPAVKMVVLDPHPTVVGCSKAPFNPAYTVEKNACLLFGGSKAREAFVIPNGGHAVFNRLNPVTMDLYVDGTSPFQCRIDIDGRFAGKFRFTGTGPRMAVVQCMTLSGVAGSRFVVTVTGGTMVLGGALFGVK